MLLKSCLNAKVVYSRLVRIHFDHSQKRIPIFFIFCIFHRPYRTQTNLPHWRCTNIRKGASVGTGEHYLHWKCIANRAERFSTITSQGIWLEGRRSLWRQSDDVLLNRRLSTSSEKHESIFYEWNGLLRDFGRPRVMNDTWSKMEAIQSRLDCGIWWFRLENITDLKTTFCGD